MRALFFLTGIFLSGSAIAEQDSRYYWDVHADHHRYRYYKPNEGRYYEWTRPELSEVSICMELDSETKGEQYRMVVEDEYCPRMRKTYAWSEPGHGHHSRCFLVDAETKGLRFRRLAKDDKPCGKARPKTTYAWVKTENDRREACYSVDTETRGVKFRAPARSTSCPMVFDAYVAFGKKQPLLQPLVPVYDKPGPGHDQQGGGRMPASLAKPAPAEEETEEDISKYREDPEDLLEHVPGSSRKGY